MAGINRTAKLKFAHPGLATTATHTEDRLVIQNDIGTTDAHVIVIHVQKLSVSVTYTDVASRASRLLSGHAETHAVRGRGNARMLASASPFISRPGSSRRRCRRLPSLSRVSRIAACLPDDWNRARKQLRGFLRAPDRLALLRLRQRPRSDIAVFSNSVGRG